MDLGYSKEHRDYDSERGRGFDVTGDWKYILLDLHTTFFRLPLDEYNGDFDHHANAIKKFIYEAPYNRVFDCVEAIVSHDICPEDLLERLSSVFKRERLAYRILPDEKIIVARASEEEDKAISAALHTTRDRFDGAHTHLKTSLTFLRDNDPRQSIHESISAVESVLKSLTGKPAQDLSTALDEVARTISLHGALKKGLNNIYGYTSNEKGVRHALLETESNVTFDDSQFMLSSCAAFVTYLINKHESATALQKP